MKLVCPSCGARYEKGKFCPECGSPLSEVSTKKVLFCPSCQTEVPSGKFCPECGTKLEEREIEIGAESIAATPAVDPSTQIIEHSVDPEVEAILAKYRDEFGDMRELNKEEYAIAAEEFEKCASKGSLDGMCYLAFLYMDGKGVPEDHARAYDLLCEAERKGSKYAVAILGLFYMHGIIVEPDALEALRRFEDGYKNTQIPGLAGIIAYYYIGHEDYTKALQYAQESADKGNKAGFKALGDLYLHGLGVEQNDQLAFENYMQAAAQGEETALNQIGWMYQNGCGTDADPEQAFFWYNEAAQKGSDVGMANLAFCYQNGYGVGQDAEVAAEWFKKSAEAGYVDSMLELGEYYQSTLFDTEKSKYWLLKAVECGNAEAMNRLGVMCADDIEPNYEEAIKWYKKAIELNQPNAYRNLALCYRDGTGVKKDLKKAEELLAKAAELGIADADEIKENMFASEDNNLVDEANKLLEEGNQKEAVAIYKKLAIKGNMRAQGNYGRCFLNAWGVKQNLKEGVSWLEKSAEQGSAWSCLRLAEVYLGFDYNEKSLPIDVDKAKDYLSKAQSLGANEEEVSSLQNLLIASAEISDVVVTKDVSINNSLGIKVNFKLVVNGMVSRKLNISAYCVSFDDYKCVKKPGKPNLLDPIECKFVEEISPEYSSTVWNSFEFGIDYRRILPFEASHNETLVIIAWDVTDKKPKALTRVDIPYHISCKTHVFRSDEWSFYLIKNK